MCEFLLNMCFAEQKSQIAILNMQGFQIYGKIVILIIIVEVLIVVFRDLEMQYHSKLLELAIKNYRKEQSNTSALYDTNYIEELSSSIGKLIDRHLGSVAVETNNEIVGYLAFSDICNTHVKKIKKASSPVHGYGIEDGYDRAKIISMLFEDVSAKLFQKNVGHYVIKVYADDKDVISSYVLNQFEILCTDAIKKIETPISNTFSDGYKYYELSKQKLLDTKNILLDMWEKLVSHLRKSPTFYPGKEFTNEVYWNHVSSPATRVFVVCKNDEILGVIDTSNDSNCFINDDKYTINVGDLFIKKDYRGWNLAQELLQYVSNTLVKEGYKRIWVEHGTTNPNALRFWDKYFSSFTFTLTRQLDERVFKL